MSRESMAPVAVTMRLGPGRIAAYVRTISAIEREVFVTKYGFATIRALQLSINGKPPEDAWKQATSEIFPNSPTSQDKGCPKSAFLGLCQEGYVKGIPPRRCTHSLDNSRYAVKAAVLLKADPSLSKNKTILWSKIVQDKKHNSQLDVVLALWENDFIQFPETPS